MMHHPDPRFIPGHLYAFAPGKSNVMYITDSTKWNIEEVKFMMFVECEILSNSAVVYKFISEKGRVHENENFEDNRSMLRIVEV